MFPLPLLEIVAALVIVGLALWALGQFPIDPAIQKLIRVLVILVVAVWICYLLLGLAAGVGFGHHYLR